MIAMNVLHATRHLGLFLDLADLHALVCTSQQCANIYTGFLNTAAVTNLLRRTVNPIVWTLRNGYISRIQVCFQDSRVDPSVSNNEAIRIASSYGHAAVVELLLKDPRVDPSVSDNEAIREASRNGHAAVVELLL